MKTTSFVSALALIALCTVTTVRAETRLPAGELPISRVAAQINANGDSVEIGTSRIMVSMRLGSPSAVLADGSWLYQGYDASVGNQDLAQNRTLIVRFTANKVSGLSLADSTTVVALRNLPKQPAKSQLLAAGERR